MKAGTDLAVVPIRRGQLPTGTAEAAKAAGGCVWVIGDGIDEAIADLAGIATVELMATKASEFAPGGLAAAIAPKLGDRRHILLPGSIDGRDLGPRMAYVLERQFVANVIDFGPDAATVVHHGLLEVDQALVDPVVATVQPGTASPVDPNVALPTLQTIELDIDANLDAVVVETMAPDPATIDLADATRIVGAGNGLSDADVVDRLGRIGQHLGAALGATRVVTDAGWLPHERQIGTTGAEVDPDLYLAFGISGAVQHVMGLGDPAHIISVNTDPSCPMMSMADLAIVADANAVLAAIADQLGVDE